MRGVPSCSTPLSLCCGSAAPAPFLYCLRPIESTHPPRADPIRVELLGGSLRCPLSQDALTGSFGARRDATTLGAEHVHPGRHAPHSRAMSFQSRLVTIGVGVSRTSAARRCSVVIRSAVAGWEAK